MVINEGNTGNEVHMNQPEPLKRNILWVRHGTTLWNVEKDIWGIPTSVCCQMPKKSWLRFMNN